MSDNESFFREVDEDYRRDQLLELWKRYGAYIVGGAFVILAVVLGYTIEKKRTIEHAARGGDAFIGALTLAGEGKQDDAAKALSAIAETGSSSYKVLAQLHLAAESVAKKDNDAARKYYLAVAGDESAPKNLREFAQLQVASLSVDTESYDSLSRQLEPFRAGTSEWRFLAKDILGLSAMKAGKKEDAERLFGEIMSDGGAPQSMRQMAEVMLALLVEKPKAGQGQPAAKVDGLNDVKTQ